MGTAELVSALFFRPPPPRRVFLSFFFFFLKPVKNVPAP